MARIVRLTLAVLVLATLVSHGQAPAAPGTVRRALGENKLLDFGTYPAGRRLIDLPAVYLRAGENRLIHGRLRAQNRTRRNIGQLAGVGCGGGIVLTTRNNEGLERRYREGRGVLAVRVRSLLVADRSGWYVCSLWGAALHPGRMVALADGGGTFVEMNRSGLPGAVQLFEDRCAAVGASPGCYLVPGARAGTGFPAATVAFEAVRYGREPGETADGALWGHRAQRALDAAASGAAEGVVGDVSPPGAPTHLTYMADLQVTTCYRNTGSCLDAVDRYGTAGGSVVETQVEVVEGDLTLRHADEKAGVPGAASCPLRRRGPALRTLVTNGAHHQKIHHSFGGPLVAGSTCGRDVLVRLLVRVVSGNPIKIEAGLVPDAVGIARLWNAPWFSTAIMAVR